MIEVAPIVDTPLPFLALNDSYLSIPTLPRPLLYFLGTFHVRNQAVEWVEC